MRTALFTLMAAIVFIGCESDPTQSPQYKQLQEDADRGTTTIAERDSAINSLFGAMNRISENLRTVREKQGHMLVKADGEEQPDMEKRIMDDIASIDGLLAENKELVTRMRKQAKTSAASFSELEKTISGFERSIAEKDSEIVALKEQVASTNSSLATLIEMYRDKSQLADMQRNEMNTAWYAVGTAKELRANGVLSKEGGVAGIGAVNKLNTANMPKDYFTQVDVTSTLEVPVMARKAKLATSHPEGSYRWEGGAGKLVIIDPAAFWSVSKYLVVVSE